MNSAEGYKSEPLSDSLRQEIIIRLSTLKVMAATEQRKLPILKRDDPEVKLARLQGNIASLEWVLREADFPR